MLIPEPVYLKFHELAEELEFQGQPSMAWRTRGAVDAAAGLPAFDEVPPLYEAAYLRAYEETVAVGDYV